MNPHHTRKEIAMIVTRSRMVVLVGGSLYLLVMAAAPAGDSVPVVR